MTDRLALRIALAHPDLGTPDTAPDALELFRGACWEFLGACFLGAPPGVLREFARAVYASRADIAGRVLL